MFILQVRGDIMNVEHIHHYSHHLGRDMNIRVYGHDGLPIVAFPCQDGNCYNYEGYGFLDNIADYIDGGQMSGAIRDGAPGGRSSIFTI